MGDKRGPSLRSLVSRLFLAVFLTLAGLAGLLIPRLRHPRLQELLSPFREAVPPLDPLCLEFPAEILAQPLLKRQFQIDLVSAALALGGFFMILYYRRRLAPILKRLEEFGLDR